jgi:peptidyl-prolyl cis-trans isomerase C
MKKILTLSLLTATLVAPVVNAQDKVVAPKTEKTNAGDYWAFLPEVVATVDGNKITKEDVIKRVEAMTAPLQRQGLKVEQLPPQFLNNYLKQAIKSLIDSKILLAVAEKGGLKATKEIIPQAVAMFEKQIEKQKNLFKTLPEKQRKAIEENLKKQKKMTVEQFIDSQKDQMKKDVEKQSSNADYLKNLAIQLWINNNVVEKVKISPADIQDYYKKHSKEFTQDETVTASHILIIPEGADARSGKVATPEADAKAKLKIEEIKKELDEGKDFGELAEKYSMCPSGKRDKGNLGPFKNGMMDRGFEKAAFSLNKGDVSGIV